MKKYFMCETGNELNFGDTIELDLTKDMEDGTVMHKDVSCKFHPILVDSLIEDGIIEEKEVEDEEEFNEEDQTIEEFFEEILDGYAELEERITDLEDIVAELNEKLRK